MSLIFCFQTIQSRFDRRLHEIERDMKPKREDQQRKLPISIYNDENKNFQSPTKSNKQTSISLYFSLIFISKLF